MSVSTGRAKDCNTFSDAFFVKHNCFSGFHASFGGRRGTVVAENFFRMEVRQQRISRQCGMYCNPSRVFGYVEREIFGRSFLGIFLVTFDHNDFLRGFLRDAWGRVHDLHYLGSGWSDAFGDWGEGCFYELGLFGTFLLFQEKTLNGAFHRYFFFWRCMRWRMFCKKGGQFLLRGGCVGLVCFNSIHGCIPGSINNSSEVANFSR